MELQRARDDGDSLQEGSDSLLCVQSEVVPSALQDDQSPTLKTLQVPEQEPALSKHCTAQV